MFKLLALLIGLASLTACASSAETQEHCTPQYPPGPCADTSAPPPKSK